MLQVLFFALIVKPFVRIVVGLNGYHLDRLPQQGPALVVANHNSHLDTLVLMSLFPLRHIRKVRPVAAADYFLRNRAVAWLSQKLIGIIPIFRKNEGTGDPLNGVYSALDRGETVILFPEGTRGDPETMGPFKMGISKVAEKNPSTPVVPIYLHGLGKSLPRGEALLVPFFCDVAVGEPLTWKCMDTPNRQEFLAKLENDVQALKSLMPHQTWD